MNCDKWLPLIEEYLDGELDESSVKRVRAHLAACQACTGEYEQLRREQALYLSYVRDVDVTPELWATVQARIQQEGAGPGILDRIRRLVSAFTAGPRLSPAYAMLLVILAVAVTVIVVRRSEKKSGGEVAGVTITPTPGPTASTSPSSSGSPTPAQSPEPPAPKREPAPAEPKLARDLGTRLPRPVVKPTEPTAEQAVREAEEKYVAAIAILSRDINKHRSELDPAIAAKFEATLASIDFTIRETRRAVREHPGDPVAAQYMLAAYSEKVDVLREMVGQ